MVATYKKAQINGKGREVRKISYRSSGQKQRKRQRPRNRGIVRKSSWKRSVTVKVRRSGVKDSGGEREVGSPTILSARACAVVTSAF